MYTFIFIILIHFIADFIFQDEQWAIGKSKALSPLLKHTITYSLIWFIPVWIMSGDLEGSLGFVTVTFITHTLTDYFTSKRVSKSFADKYYGSSIPNFGAFTIIGLDQVIHYTQLILTWDWLFSFTF